jgi:hypothetical protein
LNEMIIFFQARKNGIRRNPSSLHKECCSVVEM